MGLTPYPYTFRLRGINSKGFTANTVQGSTLLTHVSSRGDWFFGDVVSGYGLPDGTTIVTVGSFVTDDDHWFTVSQPATVTLNGQSFNQATGFVCRALNSVGNPWSVQLYGTIPNRLSSGSPGLNDASNVTYTSWEDLNTGGMGAVEAKDFSRYAWTSGIYTGDKHEWYLQPQPLRFTKSASCLTDASGQTIRQIIRWIVPQTVTPVPLAVATLVVTPLTSKVSGLQGTIAPDDGARDYCVTTVTATGESVPGPVAGAVAPALTFFGANFLMWPAVAGAIGFNVYARLGTTGTFHLIGSVANNTIKRTKSGVDYRFADTGLVISDVAPPATAPPTVTATVYRMLVIASTATTTAVYSIPDVAAAMGTVISALPMRTVSLTDAAGALIANNTAILASGGGVTTLAGSVGYNACTVYKNRVVIPTFIAGSSTVVMRQIWWDDSAVAGPTASGTPGAQVGDLIGTATSTTPMTAPIGQLAYSDANRLWYTNNNFAFWCADPFGPTPQWAGPMPCGGRDQPIRRLIGYGSTESSDSNALYATRGDGLYRNLTTDQGPGNRFERVVDFGVSDDYSGTMVVEHRGELYINVRNKVFRYSIGKIDSGSPNKDQGLCATLDGWFWAGASTSSHFYGMLWPPGNAGYGPAHGYSQIVETELGEAWHQLQCSSSAVATFTGTVTDGLATVSAVSPVAGLTIGAVITNGHFPGGTSIVAINSTTSVMTLSNPATGAGAGETFTIVVNTMSETTAADGTQWTGRVMELVTNQYSRDGNAYLLFTGHSELADVPEIDNTIYRLPIRTSQARLRDTPGYIPRSRGILRLPPYFGQHGAISKVWYWLQLTQNMDAPAPFAVLNLSGRLRTPASISGLFQTLGQITASAAGILYPSGPLRQTISGYNASDPAAAGPSVTSEGYELLIGMQPGTGNTTLVMKDITLTSTETNLSLKRWVFQVVLAYKTTYDDHAVRQTLYSDVVAQQTVLETAARNLVPQVLTDPYGVDHIVRVDVGPFLPIAFEQRANSLSQPVVEPDSLSVAVTCTEIYASS